MRNQILRMILVLLLVWMPTVEPSDSPAKNIRPEVEKLFAEYQPYDTSPHLVKQLITALKGLGITTAEDLCPYLESSDHVKRVALYVIYQDFGRLSVYTVGSPPLATPQFSTLATIENIALTTKDPSSEGFAVTIILRSKSRDDKISFAAKLLPKIDINGFQTLIGWIGGLDPSWVTKDKRAVELVKACCKRMKAFFEGGRLHSHYPATVALIIRDSAIFHNPEFVPDVTDALLAAVANPRGMQDFSIIMCFYVLMQNAKIVPDAVEKGLMDIALNGTLPQAKITLWHIFRDKHDKTPLGKRVVDAVAARRPELVDYIARLRGATLPASFEGEIGKEIMQAIRQLPKTTSRNGAK